ncbi:MAG TPA: PHB depolymerase family esterase [Frateuria sp.]|uniref:extracellular catalytic domain type 1 short-chain-length polyhydroxyalkanoate depolymerase n=1 Tax=Frateuria sp. TaxID=2211372 RepID=UPI002D7E79F9|nr:PHB depolymerase family esterase [Frateuria sp.]HET6806401.1 PHB depolymerase family esterase [Frateuria sp.]
MKHILPDALRDATRLTRSGRLTEATAALQRLLGGEAAQGRTNTPTPCDPPTIEGVAEAVGTAGARRAPHAGSATPSALRGVLDQIGHPAFRMPGGGLAHPSSTQAPIAVAEGAQFLSATFSNQAGCRPYKLYVPSGYRMEQALPLVVMLHGCTQSPDDFAAGTRMNEAAEAHTCLVAYPAQTSAANLQKCWNWFNASDQQRNGGEPSLIAGITGAIMREYAVDPQRVYVAGLSAGGAAASVMGHTYPDLYAAIGVHSGLACGAAHDMPSAFAAMQRGSDGIARSGRSPRIVPAIVFHGDRDPTVHPRNSDAVVAQTAQTARFATHTEDGRVPGGYAYRRTLHADADGQTIVEHWLVRGAGHAWFGGSPAGSYTDPGGPDATREMLRFFLEHPHPTAVRGV